MIQFAFLLPIALITFGEYGSAQTDYDANSIVPKIDDRKASFYFRYPPAGYSCTCMQRNLCEQKIFVSSKYCPRGQQCCLNQERDYVKIDILPDAPVAQAGSEYSYKSEVFPKISPTFYRTLPTGFSCSCKHTSNCNFSIFVDSVKCNVEGQMCCVELFGSK